jgi:hypothetical protein
MKSYDFEAVAYFPGYGQGASVLCAGCLPDGVSVEDQRVHPIFASEEVDAYPTCDKCGRLHDYMNLTAHGAAEAKAAADARFEAVLLYGQYPMQQTAKVFCVGCMPEGVSVDDDNVHTIRADSRFDEFPVCVKCGKVHDYMGLREEEEAGDESTGADVREGGTK